MTIQENMTTQKKITAQKKIIDPGRTKQNVFNQQEDPCRTYCFSCRDCEKKSVNKILL